MPPDHLIQHLPPQTSLVPCESVPGISLWLMEVDDTLQLNAAEIQNWWSAMPYWAFAWAGGRSLAQWILQNPDSVRGKRVLDFGCGSGLVAIAAAQAGAKEVWAVDIDTVALEAVQANASLNGVELQVATDWTRVPAECFFASDVLYDPGSHATLAALMEHCSHGWLAEPAGILNNTVVLPAAVCIAEAIHVPCSSTLPEIGDFDCAVDIEVLPVFRMGDGC